MLSEATSVPCYLYFDRSGVRCEAVVPNQIIGRHLQCKWAFRAEAIP